MKKVMLSALIAFGIVASAVGFSYVGNNAGAKSMSSTLACGSC